MPNIRGCEQCELIAFLTNSLFPLESASADVPPAQSRQLWIKAEEQHESRTVWGEKDNNIG